MNTKRNKRWNGEISTLSTDYLKNVIEKMQAYGENMQFSINGNLAGPNYQVINTAGKKIIFNSLNLLIQHEENEFLEPVYSLDQIKALLNKKNCPTVKSSVVRARRVSSATGSYSSADRTGTPTGISGVKTSSALARVKDQIAHEKYEYYKANRESLPSDIREHSEEITRLMESGRSAEEAFAEAVKLCFDHTM